MRISCNQCVYWSVVESRTGTGECRRFPPQPYFNPMGQMDRISPRTGAYFWCGEAKDSGLKIPTGQDKIKEEFDKVKL